MPVTKTVSAPPAVKGPRGRLRPLGIEVVLISLTIGLATFVFTRQHFVTQLGRASKFSVPGERELAPLVERYGPPQFSRNAEELVIRDFFGDRRDGVFLDVGANHYRDESNTYYLETELGWSGVAVDALGEFAADYGRYRPRTRFVTAFASDVSDGTIDFFVPDTNKLVASSDVDFTRRMKSPGVARQVSTATLTAILDAAGIQRIDLLSMDIELSEPKALAGFDIDRFKPQFVCIEGHPEVRQKIIDYFASHGYVIAGKYLRMDSENLYFFPAAHAPE
jgi:FkbM family methyltransferase